MKGLIVLVFMILLGSSALADSFERIYHAQSLDELAQIDKEIREERANRENCLQEIQHRAFPAHCFSYLATLIVIPEMTERYKKLSLKVSHLCQLRAEKVSNKEVLENLLSQSLLKPNCRKALEERKEDLEYIE